MKFRLSLLALGMAVLLQAQMQMNVQQLADFVRSELALKQQSDRKLADYIRKIQLTEKLTDKTITDLEAQGAGPHTIEALQHLRDETAKMKPPTSSATYSPATAPDNTLTSGPATMTLSSKAAPLPPPDSVRQQQILDMVRQYALNYTQNLPNFICVEVTRQFVDFDASDHYRAVGTLLAKVSYNGGQEKYAVYSVNGHFQAQDTTMEHAATNGGAISTGEFGSMMRSIFEPRSQAEFNWDHWGTLRGRKMAVFNFFIDSGHSSYTISYSSGPGDEQHIVTAYRGLVYADENTGEIDRIKFIAVDIPKSFPVSETTEILDYDQVNINGQPYICPMLAQLYMTAGRQKSKNEIEFRDYRKFGTESNIIYSDAAPPPPLPAAKTQEQPATTVGKGDPAQPGTTSSTATAPQQQPAKPATKSGTSDPFSLPAPPPPPIPHL